MKSHPNLMTGDNGNTPSNTLDALDPTSENFRTVQYKGRSSFRHKGGNQGLIRDFGNRKKTDNLVRCLRTRRYLFKLIAI